MTLLTKLSNKMALIVARLDTCPEIKKGVCMLDDLFCNFGVFAGSSVNTPPPQKKKVTNYRYNKVVMVKGVGTSFSSFMVRNMNWCIDLPYMQLIVYKKRSSLRFYLNSIDSIAYSSWWIPSQKQI